jgi:small neutral amino acid transporter SnatA (MarC family)
MPVDSLKTAFVALLVTLDPPGLAPVFVGLTLGMGSAAGREVALRACPIAFAILAAFALGGRTVLEALGITIPAFRVAGGAVAVLCRLRHVVRPARRAQARDRERRADGRPYPQCRGLSPRDSAYGSARRDHRNHAARRSPAAT